MTRGAAVLLTAAAVLPACGEGSRDSGSASRARTGLPPPGEELFEDVTLAAGIDFVHHVADGPMDSLLEAVGSGATWFDADGDGHLDLFLADTPWTEGVSTGERPGGPPPRNRFFRNRGDGTFEDATDRAGLGLSRFTYGAVAADADGDGDTDLYVLAVGGNVLHVNLGDGTFEDATSSAGVAGPGTTVAATFLDADRDGDLDLYLANYVVFDPTYRLHYGPDNFPGPLAYPASPDVLYRNRGDGTFEDATRGSGIDVAEPGRAMGVVATDLDGDGRTDLYVANDASANFLFRGLGDGRFEEVGVRAGVAYGVQGDSTASMAGVVGDADGDGRPDLLVTDSSYGSLYRNLGNCTFADRILASGIAPIKAQWASWGGGFLDFDEDGDLDLFLANGDLHHATGRPDLLLANRGDGTFEDASPGSGAYFRRELPSRGGAIADFDDDGDADVLVTTVGGPAVLLRNRGNPAHHRVTLDLRGRGPGTDALGARVTVEAGGRRQVAVKHLVTGYLTQADPRLRFGLGTATKVDRVEIVWPGGAVQEFRDLAADRTWRIVEGGTAQ